MAEYIYSTKNYKEILLINTCTSTDFIAKYISGLNYTGFTRYLISENRKYTTVKRLKTEESYLYKILEGEEFDIGYAVINGHLEVVKYLYGKGLKANEDGIGFAAENGHLEVVKYLYSSGTSKDKGLKATENGIDLAAGNGRVTSKTT
jgi:hypothetical protein